MSTSQRASKEEEMNALECGQRRIVLERFAESVRTLGTDVVEAEAAWWRGTGHNLECEPGKRRYHKKTHNSDVRVTLLLSAPATVRAPSSPILLLLRLHVRSEKIGRSES